MRHLGGGREIELSRTMGAGALGASKIMALTLILWCFQTLSCMRGSLGTGGEELVPTFA